MSRRAVHGRQGRASTPAVTGRPAADSLTSALLAGLLLLVVGHAGARAWHQEGHRVVTLLAIDLVKDSLPSFFGAGEQLAAHCSGDPDVVRDRAVPQVRDQENPEHFIDLEQLGGKRLPDTRYEFVALCAKIGVRPQDVGLLPYAVVENTQRLVMMLAEYRAWPADRDVQTKCLVYAGLLSHYVADLEQPLHLTIDFDGKAGKDGASPHTGIHDKVDALMNSGGIGGSGLLQGLAPAFRADLMAAVVTEIDTVRTRIGPLHAIEAALPARGSVPADPRVVAFARERARGAAIFLGSLYLTAWKMSGKIQLPAWDTRGHAPASTGAHSGAAK